LVPPSRPSSPKNKLLSKISATFQVGDSMRRNIAVAIGTSNLVHTFFISEGARFSTILRGGRSTHVLRNDALILSFDSLMAASGSQIISIVGSALFASTSTVT